MGGGFRKSWPHPPNYAWGIIVDPLKYYTTIQREEEDTPMQAEMKREALAEKDSGVDAWVGAMTLTNPIVSFFNSPRINYGIYDANYNPYVDDAKLVRQYGPDLFTNSHSRETTRQIIDNYEYLQRQRELVGRHGAIDFFGSIQGTASDPLLWGNPGRSLMSFTAKEMGREAVSEMMMHESQVGRTVEESMFEVAATGVGAGVLGAIGKQFGMFGEVPPGAVRADDVDEVEAGADALRDMPGDLSAAQADVYAAEELAPTAEGLTKVLGGLSDTARTYTKSESAVTREFINKMAPIGFQTRAAKEGIAVAPRNVWALAKKTETDIAMLEKEFNQAYKAYRKNGGKLNEKNFDKEVAKAMRNADSSNIPEVATLASKFRKLDDELYDEMVRIGAYGEEVKLGIKRRPALIGALTHLQRVYHRNNLLDPNVTEKVRPLLRQRIIARTNYRDYPGITQQTKIDLADEQINNLFRELRGLSADADSVGDFVRAPKAGIAHQRTLDLLTDNELSDAGLLVDSARDVLALTSKEARREAALADVFGERDLKGVKSAIARDYDAKIDNAKTAKERKRLEAAKVRDMNYVDRQLAQMYGIHQAPKDPTAASTNILSALRAYNVATGLVNPILTNISDMVAPLLRYNLLTVAGAYKTMFTAGWTHSKQLVNDLALANEMLTGVRVSAIMDAGHTPSEKGLQKVYQFWGKWSGMKAITDVAETAAGLMLTRQWHKELVVKGYANLSNKAKSRLAESGIGEEHADRIADMMKKHQQEHRGAIDPRTRAWEDREAARVYESAMVSEVKGKLVLEPQTGDLPQLFTSGEYAGVGKVIGQFVSFMYSATQRYTLLGLQRRDAEFLVGAMFMTGIGVAVDMTKTELKGKTWSDKDIADKIIDGLDRGGAAGLLGMGLAGGRNILKQNYMGRMLEKEPWSIAMGPGPAIIANNIIAIKKVASGEATDHDKYRAIKSIPFINLYNFMDLIEMMNEGRGHQD
jgi:hypothetical protein